jgi:DNA-binding NarL/FixJ family response regulator
MSMVPTIRVMIVEDQVIVAKELRATLERAGLAVTAVIARGEDALGMVERDNPDVVLMDLVLRGRMDGMEATRLIKQAHPGITVIGLSMHYDPALSQAMLEAGASAFLRKSCYVEELLQTIAATSGQRDDPPTA